ncbi:MAG: methyltransferase domain-containing protein [Ignavibacteriae bacterium]|nr:methyltransferase domain-containing protein [Ignavibacteriota bacterium]
MVLNDDLPPAGHTGNANVSCYDEYYDKPEWWFRFRYDTQIKKRTCQSLVRRGGKSRHGQRVCELGFGSGAFLFSFPSDCVIHGLEISHSAVSRAERIAHQRGYRSARFDQVSGAALPLADRSVDIFAASHVLEHVPNDIATLTEINRVLDDQGIASHRGSINEKYEDPNHARQYDLTSLCAAGGDRIRRDRIDGERDTILSCRTLLFRTLQHPLEIARSHDRRRIQHPRLIAATLDLPFHRSDLQRVRHAATSSG